MKLGNIALAACLLLVIGCASETILTNSPDFRAVEAKRFVLLKECYVFRFVGEKDKYPMVGCYSETPGVGVPSFPKNAKDFVGRRIDGVEIFDVLPKGTVFTVVQLRQESNFEDMLTSFDISPIGRLGERWPLLDGLWLTNSRTNQFSFFPEIVGPVE